MSKQEQPGIGKRQGQTTGMVRTITALFFIQGPEKFNVLHRGGDGSRGKEMGRRQHTTWGYLLGISTKGIEKELFEGPCADHDLAGNSCICGSD